jgi:hypothetical protein
MSDLQFGGPPKNGKQVTVTSGHPAPTPYRAEVWVDGALVETRYFMTETQASKFQREEDRPRRA